MRGNTTDFPLPNTVTINGTTACNAGGHIVRDDVQVDRVDPTSWVPSRFSYLPPCPAARLTLGPSVFYVIQLGGMGGGKRVQMHLPVDVRALGRSAYLPAVLAASSGFGTVP